MKDTNRYILDSEGDKDVPGSRDMTKMPNYAGKPIVIRSHQDSGDYYAMVKVKVVGRIKKHLSGCRVNYTQGSTKYSEGALRIRTRHEVATGKTNRHHHTRCAAGAVTPWRR
ncbi:hypothetical protein [Streptomyces sp. NPDC010273]|uniref:hypothetical protein n=1 Tax=Streptomyces sp. NPDC010273 TaxID=3364829 RepID=UPI0036F0F6B8